MNDKEIQLKFILFLAKKSGAKTLQELENYIKNLGKEGLEKAQIEFIEEMKKLKVKAAHGAKLNYIKFLKHQCAEDEELYYYKSGGSVGCGCIKKNEEGGQTPLKKKNDPIKDFKKKKSLDLAAQDSIAINKYGAEDLESTRPGTYKKDSKGKVTWVPDRTKPPYKKEEGGIVDKFMNTAGKVLSTMSKAGWTAAKATSGYYEKPKPKKKDPKQTTQNTKDTKDWDEPFTPKNSRPSPNGKINRGGTKSQIEHMCGGSKVVAKFKKHRQGGSLNGIPFYLEGTSKGGMIVKSDNTRVQKIPNNGEGIIEEMPIGYQDMIPIVGTFREALRLNNNDPNASKLGFGISLAGDLAGAGMVGPVLRAASKYNKVSKALKSRGFVNLTGKNLYIKIGSKETPINAGRFGTIGYRTEPAVYIKNVPQVDVSGIALTPLVLTLRVPGMAAAH